MHETFLYLSGLTLEGTIDLAEGVQLQPAAMPPSLDVSALRQPSMDELAIATLCLPRVRSQLHVTGASPMEVAIRGWNALWDVVLLAALLRTEAMCNLHGTCAASDLRDGSELSVSNTHLYGFKSEPKAVAPADTEWLAAHYASARVLIDHTVFQDATAALWSYRWHLRPRAQLAVLWSGIEGLFEIDSEVTFRVSLGIARFLEPDDRERRVELFDRVKKLYRHRSRAVHGGHMKPEANAAVEPSAALLQSLLRRCAEQGSVPDEKALVV